VMPGKVSFRLDAGAVVSGPPWVCEACGTTLEPGAIDGHLLDHLRQRLEQLEGVHACDPPTLARWLRWRWARFKDWWRR